MCFFLTIVVWSLTQTHSQISRLVVFVVLLFAFFFSGLPLETITAGRIFSWWHLFARLPAVSVCALFCFSPWVTFVFSYTPYIRKKGQLCFSPYIHLQTDLNVDSNVRNVCCGNNLHLFQSFSSQVVLFTTVFQFVPQSVFICAVNPVTASSKTFPVVVFFTCTLF